MSSSDSEEENTFRFGTPLEPYEEDEVPSKRRAQQQNSQYAVDAHGRRRFHGAFTGGFSAGHGNSVDTPEGWTPSTFKSSRGERAAYKQSMPEDFMDEEDREEFGIAPRQIHTQQDFSGKKRVHTSQRFHDGPIPGEPVLEQFVRAVPETAALRILRGMGWRPGRNVGERVEKKKKKTYGCYVPPEYRQNKEDSSDADSDLEDVDYDTLFANEPEMANNKTDRFGLGYVPLSRHSVLGSMAGEYGSGGSVSHLKMRDKGKKVSIRGQAFGVGALEEEDEDVYSTTDMTHYDFAIGGYSSTQKLPDKAKRKSEGLEGFVRASKPPSTPRVYPPPALPRDYKPAPAGFRMTRFEKPSEVEKRGRHDLSSEDRGAFLGEPPPLPPVSINPPIKPLVAKITEGVTNFVGINDSGEASVASAHRSNADNVVHVQNLSRDTEQEYSADCGVFMPFASNPEKQARYEQFLKGDDSTELSADDRIAEWEAAREKMEFEQAKKLYRPLTGFLNDRFTTGSGASEQPQTTALSDQMNAARSGMYGHLTRAQAEWRPDSLVCKRFNVPDPFEQRSDRQSAKQQKSTSYSIFEYLESSIHSKDSFAKEQSQFSGSKSLQAVNANKSIESNFPIKLIIPLAKNAPKIIEPDDKIHGNKRITVADLFLMEAEKDRLAEAETDTSTGDVTRTIDKFDKMELYNSIFITDSEDDEEKDEKSFSVNVIEKPVNSERNTSPPRGIFANIDFDKLNARPSKNAEKIHDEKSNNDHNNKVSLKDESRTQQNSKDTPGEPEKDIRDRDIEDLLTNDEENSIYGPKIPEDLQKRIEQKASEQSPDIIYGNTSVSQTVYKEMDIDEVFNGKTKDIDVYGPKIPETLKRYIDEKSSERNPAFIYSNASVSRTAYKEMDIEEVLSSQNLKPVFRAKKTRESAVTIEPSSSSDSDAWVAITETKKNKKKKKHKKHKHKSKDKNKRKNR